MWSVSKGNPKEGDEADSLSVDTAVLALATSGGIAGKSNACAMGITIGIGDAYFEKVERTSSTIATPSIVGQVDSLLSGVRN